MVAWKTDMSAQFGALIRPLVKNIDNLIDAALPTVKMIFVATIDIWPWIAAAALLIFVGLLVYKR